MFKIGIVLIAVISLSTTLGCAGGYKPATGIKVKGKITKGGQPLTVPNMAVRVGMVKVDLYPIGSDANDSRSKEGTLGNEDGTFEIVGAGQGIKPGKYKLSIVADPGDGKDQLGGKYSAANSPIQVEVLEKYQGATQDLGTLQVE